MKDAPLGSRDVAGRVERREQPVHGRARAAGVGGELERGCTTAPVDRAQQVEAVYEGAHFAVFRDAGGCHGERAVTSGTRIRSFSISATGDFSQRVARRSIMPGRRNALENPPSRISFSGRSAGVVWRFGTDHVEAMLWAATLAALALPYAAAAAYFAAGAAEVWIVDPVGKTIAVFGAEGARAASRFAVDLTTLFDL